MNTKTLRKLRFKFIGAAMLSFSLVAIFVGILINVVNFFITEREMNWTLNQILERQEDIENEDDKSEHFSDAPSWFEVFSPNYNSNDFYIFTFDENGNEIAFGSNRNNRYSEEAARKQAASILQEGKTKGRSGLYTYQVGLDDNGDTILVLLDCSEIIFGRMRLLYTSIGVGIAAVIVTFILVLRLSKKMIEPEMEMSKNQMKFLTNVSHELKTPLAVIRSNAEMEEIMNGENEWTRSTIRQVDRMNGLIRNLVMITKLQEMEDDAITSEISASSVVTDTAREFRVMAESSGKAFEMNIEEGLTITAEESKVRQLVMILLDNAVKYCDENGKIAVSLEARRRGRIRLTVSNTYAEGSTIDCSRFFDRFYREDESHNIDSGGYGIGLSIAESICSQMDGKILAEWKGGSIFFICEF